MLVFACWNANSNTTAGVIRFCGWVLMLGKLSLRQIHLGILTADVQKHKERERESTNPWGKALLVIGVILNYLWEACESMKKREHFSNCLNQTRLTCLSKTKPFQLQNWSKMLHCIQGEGSKWIACSDRRFRRCCEWTIGSSSYGVQDAVLCSLCNWKCLRPAGSHYPPHHLRSLSPR